VPDIFLYPGEPNPADIRLRDPTVLASSSPSLSGSILEGSDSAAGTLTLELNLSGAVTEGSDAVAGTVGLALSLSGAIAEGSDAVAGTLALQINISGAIQEGSDVVGGSLDLVGAVPPVQETPSFGANLRWNKRLAPRKKKKREPEREPELVFETPSVPMAVLPPVDAPFETSDDDELMQALTYMLLDIEDVDISEDKDEDEVLALTFIMKRLQ
jgi:hypothetical protein